MGRTRPPAGLGDNQVRLGQFKFYVQLCTVCFVRLKMYGKNVRFVRLKMYERNVHFVRLKMYEKNCTLKCWELSVNNPFGQLEIAIFFGQSEV